MWLDKLYSQNSKLYFIINGRTMRFFNCSRDFRQGDHLPPFLFFIAEEVLSRRLSNISSMGKIVKMIAPRDIIIPSHVLFVRDIKQFLDTHGNA